MNTIEQTITMTECPSGAMAPMTYTLRAKALTTSAPRCDYRTRSKGP